ncbi:carbohydrate ABC transporter permease [Paenibacillus nasutitermitis]|uniref:ABC transporter permease protein YtcP n=1 Tax=Paenibacillus nasutitermitis TaxID=1652958 RepID=A0A916Z2E5_9BACL|nr:carbohydrate ABC transporter permease [Paenibacillus nasutitermitis]GGD72813.1 putative ABC transporter permease protein YtcP [Paenibacillus nasutitermitis]
MHRYVSPSRFLFQLFNYTFFVVFCISILVPFINAIAISLSSYNGVLSGKIGLWPIEFQLDSYIKLAGNVTFLRSFANTVFLTVINTGLSVTISLCGAYALSHKNFIGRNAAFTFILITMFFSGGLIPTYLLVLGIGLGNTFGALILPGLVSGFYIIVYKNVIDQLPKELMESAEIDGAGEWRLLFRIVLPLVLPMTMAFIIFSAVAYWNQWFNVLLYIKDKSMWTLQFQLREILTTAQLMDDQLNPVGQQVIHPENLKMAALMITILPIIAVYPFVQKYFIHGQFVGAVKG